MSRPPASGSNASKINALQDQLDSLTIAVKQNTKYIQQQQALLYEIVQVLIGETQPSVELHHSHRQSSPAAAVSPPFNRIAGQKKDYILALARNLQESSNKKEKRRNQRPAWDDSTVVHSQNRRPLKDAAQPKRTNGIAHLIQELQHVYGDCTRSKPKKSKGLEYLDESQLAALRQALKRLKQRTGSVGNNRKQEIPTPARRVQPVEQAGDKIPSTSIQDAEMDALCDKICEHLIQQQLASLEST